MSCDPRNASRPFRLSEIERPEYHGYGIYGFWYRGRCIYIGKAEDQVLTERLKQHWANCHNDLLKQWLAAKPGEIRFVVKMIDHKEQIQVYEKFYIRRFQPITNKIRYQSK
ncbi:GIY-YIG nuclease family protein [Thioalkalivibrio sulfidiphilus]|uniref:GIY-YIG nuclease family protein n=1 Tax=Thioalkalivibrio sulfidiphilus TaxID=1033854 RepID=UPI0009D92076